MKLFKQENEGRKKFPINAILTYVLIATIAFSAISFASYASQASGSDSARVAKVNVVTAPTFEDGAAVTPIECKVTEGEENNAKVDFTISNNDSEVSLKYSVIVESSVAIPECVSVILQKDSVPFVPTISGDRKTFTFSCDNNTGMPTFEAGTTETYIYTLVFDDVDGASFEDGEIKGITLKVITEQID